MDQRLLEKLSGVSREEEAILAGRETIDRSLYYSDAGEGGKSRRTEEIDAARVLQNGRLIDIRRHVRFVQFPKHTHNFVEFVYMCQGSTTHIIDGNRLTLKQGELLFLNQHAAQEIEPAGREDIAVNFMILPEFFDTAFRMLGSEESELRRFLVSCLTDRDMGGNCLCFHVSDLPEVQNLVENLIWILFSEDTPRTRTLSQTTMGLLFLHLVDAADRITVPQNSYEEELMIRLLDGIENRYRSITLEGFCRDSHVDLYTMERLIRKRTGRTFRDLLQERRLNQACFLLDHTELTVGSIASAVGYENSSFFHRLFRRRYGMSPAEYRRRPKAEN